MTQPSCKKDIITVQGAVKKITQSSAIISLYASSQKNCQQCQDKGGCQSLSLYQLFFAKRPILIKNENYHIGQRLTVAFPNALIIQSIGLLLGLPLLGFLLGAAVASSHHELLGFGLGLGVALITYCFSQRLIQNRLLSKITISTTD